MTRPLPPLLAGIGAVISGLLYWLAFAGMDLWPFAFVALVPMWISIRHQPAKRAAWIAWLTGLTMNLGGFRWLLDMLQTFSGFPIALCLLFMTIVCAYQGLRLAFMGWLFGRATSRGWDAPRMFMGAFCVSELVFPLLFPWYFAATVHQVPILIQVADMGGPILVGLVLVCVNLAIAEPIVARLEQRAMERRVLFTGAGALALALVYGAIRINQVDAAAQASEPVKVGFVQGNMELIRKREDPAEGLRRHKRLTAQLKAQGAELVVWSESSVTFAVPEKMAPTFLHDRVSRELGVPAIFGAVVFRVDPDRERWFNTAVATNAQGTVTGRYDKHFLLAFGEYLPFGDTFPELYKMSPNSGKFTQGTGLDPLSVNINGRDHSITTLICYEDILPGFTNDAVAQANADGKPPELLVNITNDAWFGRTSEPYEHLALAQFRAVEHRRYLIRSTNSGVSAFVDPVGRVSGESPLFVPDAKVETLHWLTATTPYEILRDYPYWLLAIAMAIVAFRSSPRKSRG